jgi:hypothetical protein
MIGWRGGAIIWERDHNRPGESYRTLRDELHLSVFQALRARLLSFIPPGLSITPIFVS